MSYQIFCDDYPLYDIRYDDLILLKPRCKLRSNAAGEASFTILSNHPYYNYLKKMSSLFEIKQDDKTIFKGRMTSEGKDFDNKRMVELEGALSYLNDSIIPPFVFPDDFLKDTEYQGAAASGNTVRFFLGWLIDQHNSRVSDFQKFKLGNVTVKDKNNYIRRESSSYLRAFEILRSKLFETSLGGFICVRYEDDGTYIDYLASFDTENKQQIEFGENLLDLNTEMDAIETISAIIPLGSDGLTVKKLPDGSITDDIAKKGEVLYSKKAVEQYGWIYADPAETTWDDVTKAENLLSNGVDYLEKGIGFMETVTINAFDLHLTNAEIEAFRINRGVIVASNPHRINATYPVSELDIDIENPQNTTLTGGSKKKVFTDYTSSTAKDIEQIKHEYVTNHDFSSVKDKIENDIDEIDNVVEVLKSDVVSKANQDDVDNLSQRVSSTETTLVNKAEQSDVDDLKDRMDEAESALENKADQSEVDALKNRVENAETAISGLQTDFGFLGLRVASVEEGLGNVPSQSDIELINEVIEVLVGRIETLEDYMRNGNGGGM